MRNGVSYGEYRFKNIYGAHYLTRITGQIHVIVIDNWPDRCADDWYFKHYTVRAEEKCKI